MNLKAVMTEIAAAAGAIDGLNRYDRPPPRFDSPALIVGWPERYEIHKAYRNGQSRLAIPLVLLAAKPTDESARDILSALCSGPSEAGTLAAVLYAHQWVACDVLTLIDWEFDVVKLGGPEYLAGVATAEIVGRG